MQDIVSWITGVIALIGFGWSLGLNPALYGATADLLARGQRPLVRLCSMAGGLFVGATILFAALQTVDPQSFVSALRGKLDAALINRTVDLVAGVVFIVLAVLTLVWLLRVRVLPQKPAKTPKQNGGLFGYFTLGLSCSIIGFTTLPIMYLTGRLVSSLSTELVPRVIAYLIFLAALASPFFALAWLWRRFPAQSQKLEAFYARALRWDYRGALAVLFVVAGLVFLGLALLAHHTS